ncbi:uncharacterized protein PAC_01012 [Phialocephala subalpina]|uniref:BTB domain-containing protein n=1 Tax=Phialocephala subalpina TaxID=576137 RepID=A0A1L7WED8_9HELO|nr:uncharacterized protein PAC_01012 [Phialocephala subalpina]
MKHTPTHPRSSSSGLRSSNEPDHTAKKQKLDPPAFDEPSTLVTIRVGKDDDVETFLVHKEVVCRHSLVLKAAFDSGFIEGQTQTYELSHVNSETAKMLVQWLYAQEVTIKQLKQGWKYSEDKIHEAEADLEDTNLVNLWMPGEPPHKQQELTSLPDPLTTILSTVPQYAIFPVTRGQFPSKSINTSLSQAHLIPDFHHVLREDQFVIAIISNLGVERGNVEQEFKGEVHRMLIDLFRWHAQTEYCNDVSTEGASFPSSFVDQFIDMGWRSILCFGNVVHDSQGIVL